MPAGRARVIEALSDDTGEQYKRGQTQQHRSCPKDGVEIVDDRQDSAPRSTGLDSSVARQGGGNVRAASPGPYPCAWVRCVRQ